MSELWTAIYILLKNYCIFRNWSIVISMVLSMTQGPWSFLSGIGMYWNEILEHNNGVIKRIEWYEMQLCTYIVYKTRVIITASHIGFVYLGY